MRNVAERVIVLVLSCVALNVFGCAPSEEAANECYSLEQFKKLGSPSFEPYFMMVKYDDKSRLDVYIQMPYTNLRFEKTDNGFKASYGCTFIIKDDKGQIVQMKEIERLLEPRAYEETVSLRFDFFLQSFTLEPGTYLVEIMSLDNHSQLQYRYKQHVNVQSYHSDSLWASSELFLDTVVFDEKGIRLRPMLPSSVSLLNNGIGIFQELYNVNAGDTIVTAVTYAAPKTSGEESKPNYYSVPPYRVNRFSCTNAYDSIYYRVDSSFVARHTGVQQLIQFYALPSVGNTYVKRTIIRKGTSRSDTLITRFSLYRRNPRFRSSPSPDEILTVMRYILRPDEYDSIAAAKDDEQKKRINNFWEQQGGFLSKMDFERRLKEANKLFTSCSEGAKTPMGIVYVICGAPNYVDCRNSLTESWYYTIGERTFPIQFRLTKNEYGFPYYEIVPFSMNESLWHYFVEKWRKR